MIDKTEAQPEALYVADQLDETRNAFGDDSAQSKRRASAELRRQHAEIQQLKAQISARQAAADDALRDALVRARDWFESQAKVVSKGCGSPWNLMQLRDERDAADAALSAAPPPPEREPLTEARIDAIGDETGKPSKTWHYKFARAIERAHGIGATND